MLTAKISGHVKFAVSLVSFFFAQVSSWFWFALLPKMWEILNVRHMTSPPAQIQKILYVSSIQQNNWVWLCLENSLMKNRGDRIFDWNTLSFLYASSKLSSASIVLNLKLNFLKIYLTNPYDFMLEEQACSFDIWKYCSDYLISEILKISRSNFSLDMLRNFMLIKNECTKCEKR